MDANFKSMGHGCPLRLTRELSTSVIIPLEKYHSSSGPQTIGMLRGGAVSRWVFGAAAGKSKAEL